MEFDTRAAQLVFLKLKTWKSSFFAKNVRNMDVFRKKINRLPSKIDIFNQKCIGDNPLTLLSASL